ncbi:hypothetical protein VTK56DRAFT_7424 [Thermocarpiscus australiensis]
MSAPPGSSNGTGHNPLPALADLSVSDRSAAQRRLALARAARENATREEIEARGIQPDVRQIVHHMNETPAHPFKRARLNDSTARRLYRPLDSDDKHGSPSASDEESDEQYFEAQWKAMLYQEGVPRVSNNPVLAEFRQIARERLRMLKQATAEWKAARRPPPKERFDLIGSLSTCTELIVEVCKHVRPVDIVNLYSICRDFHHAINMNMRSSVFAWTSVMAPTSARIYSSPVYCDWFIPDPAGRLATSADRETSVPRPGQAKLPGLPVFNHEEDKVRLIPGLRWLQLVVHREIRVRDIIATLARMGHRLPPGAHLTLKKIWLTMDVSTTRGRIILWNNPDFFTNEDLYIAQLFFVKLILAFNDPVFGPQSSMLMRLMMGQKGLSPLWALLRGKKYRSAEEIRALKLYYDVGPDAERVASGEPLHGIPIDQLGIGHLEAWGGGPNHLMRPDELVPLEAARRQLDLDSCIDEMMIYGHVDLSTGNSLVPSIDEMYMSDDELPPAHRDWTPMRHELINGGCGNVPFARNMWLPKHARKARWNTLTDEEKEMILKEERLDRAEAYSVDGAQERFQLAWTKLAAMTAHSTRRRVRMRKFCLQGPAIGDMEDELDSLEQQLLKRARAVRKPDAMELDSDEVSGPAPPKFSHLPLRTQAEMTFGTVPPGSVYRPLTGDQLRTAVSGAMTSLGPAHMWGTEQQQQQYHQPRPPAWEPAEDADVEDTASSCSDLSFDDESLATEPIPAAEMKRFYNSVGRSLPQPQPQPQRQEPSPEPAPASLPPFYFSSPSPSASEEEEEEDDDDDDDDDEAQPEQMDISEEQEEEEFEYTIGFDSDPEDYRGHPATAADLTPETAALGITTDDMLLAQADQKYDDDDDDGCGGGGDGYGCATAAASTQGYALDWNHFLMHPNAYAVEEEYSAAGHPVDVGGEVIGVVFDGAGVDDDDLDEGGGGDDDEEEEDGNVNAGGDGDEEEDEEEEDDDQQLAQYVVDGDLREDERTKRLRDWFRPW